MVKYTENLHQKKELNHAKTGTRYKKVRYNTNRKM